MYKYAHPGFMLFQIAYMTGVPNISFNQKFEGSGNTIQKSNISGETNLKSNDLLEANQETEGLANLIRNP